LGSATPAHFTQGHADVRPLLLTKELKGTRFPSSIEILQLLEKQEPMNFAGIITRDESWFFQDSFRNHNWRLGNENAQTGSHEKLLMLLAGSA
jgi:hypothetical protein